TSAWGSSWSRPSRRPASAGSSRSPARSSAASSSASSKAWWQRTSRPPSGTRSSTRSSCWPCCSAPRDSLAAADPETDGGPRRVALVSWVVLGALLLLPLVVRDTYTMRVINVIGINSLLALGLNLVLGVAGQLDAGQAGFYAVGAYVSGLLAVRLGVPFWVTVLVAAAASGALALAIGPVLRLRGVFLAVATLAFGEIVRIVINSWVPVTNGPNGIPGIPFPSIGRFVFHTDERYYYLILGAV